MAPSSNQNQLISWSDEAGASRGGKPLNANLQFNHHCCNKFSGWVQYPGEGRVDVKGEYEMPTDVTAPGLKIGDIHEGGIVFSLTPDGVCGMVVSPNDVGPPQGWKSAQSVARSANIGGYDDWHIPSPQQWDSIYSHLVEAGIGNFQRLEWYWTSSPGYGPGWARAMDLKAQMQYQDRHPILGESWNFNVRAVRAF